MHSDSSLDTISDQCFRELLILTHELTGITIGHNRKSMLQGRLRKRIKALALRSYNEYVKIVRTNKEEQLIFIDLITTNETYFFRTPRVWEFIENIYLPEWDKSSSENRLLAWSAASSQGAEARSLGILCEHFKVNHSQFTYNIIGTDISQEMINLSIDGTYSEKLVEAFRTSRPELFSKYMRKTSEGLYQVQSEIQSRIKFKRQNLFNPMSSPHQFDLVLLRNVLIYFTPEDQRQVLSNISLNMKDGAILILGESESLSSLQTDFKNLAPFVYRFEARSSSGKVA